MCGLFGWQFHTAPSRSKRKTMAIILAMEMDYRGGDSWGYYLPDADKHKRGLGDMSFSSMREMSGASSVIAHTRRATTGDICPENSHPFRLTSLIGAHNGIVHNHADLNARHGRQCAVDSQHIFHHLESKQPLDDIEAYGAIVWQWLADPSCIYLGRFNGGELAIVRTEQGTVWASTKEAVRKACKQAGMRILASIKIDEGKEYFVRNGELWTTGESLAFRAPSYKRDWRMGLSKSEALETESYDRFQLLSKESAGTDDYTFIRDEMTLDEQLEFDFMREHGYLP